MSLVFLGEKLERVRIGQSRTRPQTSCSQPESGRLPGFSGDTRRM